MSTYLTRLPATEFGLPILDDFGLDDLSAHLFDEEPMDAAAFDERLKAILGEPMIEVPFTVTAALLTADMPAKPQPAEGYVTRTPDLYDGDMAWWIGEGATVGCPVDMVAKAADRAENGGTYARTGAYPCEQGFIVLPHSAKAVATQVALSKHQEQYDLWRAVQDTILVEVNA